MHQDPFYIVKDEVQTAINGVTSLYGRWKDLLRKVDTAKDEEFAWTTNELKSGVRAIEWDLQDLDETVSIVEANPSKFKLDDAEVASRKQFISRSRTLLGEIKQALVSNTAVAKQDADARKQLMSNAPKAKAYDKFAKLESAIDRDNNNFLDEQQQQQQLIMQDQDADLSQLQQSVGNLTEIGYTLNVELDNQNRLLDEFGNEVNDTSARMRIAVKKVNKLLVDTADKKPWLVIGCLMVILLALIVVAFEV
eukprot:TRINITY_DN218_c0_g1_i1.p1 TRINITY_DN218_c0_g1~~TRINITY_DN218_c0_g1_i1.p1  ORF type:complete len:251 (+),score=122.67 TRINITY_DN218_c0_g1_i1:95-847(+)